MTTKVYLSQADLSRRWGVHFVTVSRWRHSRENFPEPDLYLAPEQPKERDRMPRWSESTIEAFEATLKGVAA